MIFRKAGTFSPPLRKIASGLPVACTAIVFPARSLIRSMLLCALTDVLDGYIARRFDMVTELGKALDPVADKLIQAAMMLCAAARTPLVWLLLAAHILRETLMAAAGLYMLRVLGQVYGAQWYGKVCTALIYAVMIALLLFPDMPEPLAAGGVFTCVFMVLMCLVMYLADYARVLRGEKR